METAEAFVAIPLAAICCDSRFDREEARVLQDQLRHRAPYRDMAPLALAQLIDGLLREFRRDRWEELITAAVASLSPEQQETALALAAQVIHSDRVVGPEEARFLEQLAGQLSLPPERSATILEVFALLARDGL
jgi:tellurite resistance protein